MCYRVTSEDRDIIILYGNSGDVLETAIKYSGEIPSVEVVDGDGFIGSETRYNNTLILQYSTDGQTVVKVGDTLLYLLGKKISIQTVSFD